MSDHYEDQREEKTGYKLADCSMSTDYKIGDEFEVVLEGTFVTGSVIALCSDDGTHCPQFKLISGKANNTGVTRFSHWYKLKPTTKKKTVADAWAHYGGVWPTIFNAIMWNGSEFAGCNIDEFNSTDILYFVCTYDQFFQYGRNRDATVQVKSFDCDIDVDGINLQFTISGTVKTRNQLNQLYKFALELNK